MSTATAPETPAAEPQPPTAPVGGEQATAMTEADADYPPWPLTVEQYLRMIRSGIFGEDDPVFLWEGRLARRMPPERPHSIAVGKLRVLFDRVIPAATHHLETEQPLALRNRPSVPQPDLMVLRGAFDDYVEAIPTSADVSLVVEVADTSLRKDRRLAETYASDGIPVYWIVNVPERRIEVFARPVDGAYAEAIVYEIDAEVPLTIDGREVGRIPVRNVIATR